MKQQNVCNKDCFHCKFENCICDEMDAQDYRDAREIDEILQPKTLRQKKIAAKQREYREQNKEAIAAKQRGQVLRQFRTDHGYTQLEFAKWIGISRSLVSLYETGSVPYDPEIILRRFPEFRAYMESAACGEDAPQTACENNTSAL